jgi:hypothetical protein
MSNGWGPTLYKARGVPTKQPVCAICVERTRGRTTRVALGYGVYVCLCEYHSAAEFQCRRGGRDFVLTLQRLWEAHGCLTSNRRRALEAHLERMRGHRARSRPGSYAWPELRREAEMLFSSGVPIARVITRLRARPRAQPAHPPAVRTMQRWHSERRWILAAPP